MSDILDFNKIKNTVSGMADRSIDAIIGGETASNPAKPDFSKFMQKVGAEDLSRSNMFLVRFTDFSATIKADGVVTTLLNQGVGAAIQSTTDKLIDFGTDKIREYGGNVLLNSQTGKKLMGAYNPKLLKTILPGEWLDGILPTGFDVNKDLAMLVKAVTVPATSLDTTKLMFDKAPVSAVKGRTVDNITMTFYLTTGHVERAAMIQWMNMIHNPFTNEYGFYESYAQDIDIYTLDRRGVPCGVTKAVGCFPISVGAVNLDFDNNNQIATFDVEFTTSLIQVKKFDQANPLFDESLSIIQNVVTNPLYSKIKGKLF